ncbi:MAG: dihydrofolate reductase [Nesterenkonia sp.]|nr:dihydrofolate reductase [Nesterenkonia sp.]
MIWAQTVDRVIGAEGGMPWHLPEDLRHFRRTTAGAPLIMGRRTWESLPARFRPLPGRRNVVVTSSSDYAATIVEAGAETASSLDAALDLLSETPRSETGEADVWIMGGGAIYAEAVAEELAELAVVTVIDLTEPGDTLAPELPEDRWHLASSDPTSGWHTAESGVRYRIEHHHLGGRRNVD